MLWCIYIYIYYVCVCPRLSLRFFTFFYSAGVAESQKDLESLTGEVSEMEKQVQLAGESRKKENDKFSRLYFAGGARNLWWRLAPTKTLTIGCVNVPAGTPWAPSCAAWVSTQTSIFNPVSLAHRLGDAFAAITNGQQTLKNEMSNMTSQVCSRRGDLSQSRRDPGIPGLLKVPI